MFRARALAVSGLAGTLAALLVVIVWATPVALAPTPLGPHLSPHTEAQNIDRQQIAIERQLRCPQCTNERLDACQLAICEDMRSVIAERLAAGDHPDDIMLYFTQRFGDEIRWGLQPEGFNLVLFGWVGGSLLLVGAGGGWMLWRMRQDARLLVAAPPGGAAASAAGSGSATSSSAAGESGTSPTASEDERWLDEHFADQHSADEHGAEQPSPDQPAGGTPPPHDRS